jgi:hypothetical protein
MNVISEFKTMLAEVRDSFNGDYTRQILLDKRHLPFRERMRVVMNSKEYKSRAYTARTRAIWVWIVGLTPLLALALVKVSTHLLDGHDPPAVVIPIVFVYVLTTMACGWRIGSIRARRTLARQDATQRGSQHNDTTVA